MANRHDKKRQLDDEMSRFEAEISGPPEVGSVKTLQPPPPPPPAVIGANTFTQVQQRLQQKHPDPQQPPPPPGHPQPPRHPMPHAPRGPSTNGLSVLPPPPPPPPGYIGPRLPGASDGPMGHQPPLRPPPPPPPGFIPPQLNRHHMGNNMMNDGPQMNHMMGAGGGPPGFMRPPRPPGHMGPPSGPPGPPGPPGYVGPHGPPQGMSGPHMPPGQGPLGGPPGFGPGGPNQGPPHGQPRPHVPPGPPGMHRGPHPPPPPPPSVITGQPQMGPTVAASPFVPAVISKPPAVISSAPKIYTAQPTKQDAAKQESPSSPANSSPTIPPESSMEPKKKKMKGEPTPSQNSQLMTHAQEMAEKVRASIVTITSRPDGAPAATEEKKKEGKNRKNKILRCGGGQIWEDQSLGEWDNDDFRIFCGDLGNDVTDELLTRYFSHFSSFVKAKVVRDKRTNKSKGYGFISFSDPQDYIRAMKEMNGKYVGSRPIKLRKSTWKDRNLDVVHKKQKEKQLLGLK
ncbi:RNA-binding protein 42-like [Macrobrachium rosenbergii]|uniref:RNA-binding protein 42-like n=1 Tax=Macrobrachium rosenbergii TaxID=79674 RepID=UPI0034D40927